MCIVSHMQCKIVRSTSTHSEHIVSLSVIISRALQWLMQKTGFCEDLVLYVVVELFWSTRCVCQSLKRGIHERRGGKKLHTALYILSLNSVCVRLQTNHSSTLCLSVSVKSQPGKQSASVCLQELAWLLFCLLLWLLACCSSFFIIR